MIFPDIEDAGNGAVRYAHAQAVLPPDVGDAVQVFSQRGRNDESEGRQICSLIQQILQQSAEQTIAVLVRSRSHLKETLAALRDAGIPYQAQNVDPLTFLPAVADLVALLRSLLHRGDHLSWMTILRAPWCGIRLADLIHFQGHKGTSIYEMMNDDNLLSHLSSDGQLRVRALRVPLSQAFEKRGRCPLREVIEEIWLTLRGPDCYSLAACRDVEQLFGLIDKLDHGGDLLSFEQLDEELEGLFSVNEAQNGCRVQVMTIHKSKGLEFDHVILPGLGRRPRVEDKRLLRWQEHPECGLLLAPITARGDFSADPIYELLGDIEQKKSTYEVARLLYVAVTRAKHHLYLSGHADYNKNDEPRPAKGSLLEKLWPAVEGCFLGLEEVECNNERQIAHRLHRLPVSSLAAQEGQSVEVQMFTGQITLTDNEHSAIIGTVTHGWLERFAKQEFKGITVDELASLSPLIAAQFSSHGFVDSLVDTAVVRVLAMLEQTLCSERGRWILAPHSQSECELALTGYEQGELINVIIDRTFVDEGVRWIIDYKTANLAAHQSQSSFYLEQSHRYQGQLQQYAKLLQQLYPQHPCRCALYFPAFDGWCEVDKSTTVPLVGQGELF